MKKIIAATVAGLLLVAGQAAASAEASARVGDRLGVQAPVGGGVGGGAGGGGFLGTLVIGGVIIGGGLLYIVTARDDRSESD